MYAIYKPLQYYLIVIMLSSLAISCQQHPNKNSVTFSGKISGKIEDSLVLLGVNEIEHSDQKRIQIAADGTFSETFQTSPAYYDILYGNGVNFGVYLKNGYDLQITFHTKKQSETLSFNGTGTKENEYLFNKANDFWESDVHENNDQLSDRAYAKKIKSFFEAERAHLKKANFEDAEFVTLRERFINEMEEFLLSERKNDPKKLKGQPSPEFVNYQNNDGSTNSLSDYKGNYIYIDLWATWCGPCVKEIPFLTILKEKYHDLPITFISISLDDQINIIRWKKMIKEKEMGGIQLLADNALESSFCKAYAVSGIPRFIFIDPEGNILSADAPRPSDEKLLDLFAANGL